MMRHGHHGHHGHHQMMCPSHRMVSPMSAAEPIVCPPEYRFHDQFIPQEQPVIHPIVNVNREHIVPFPRHYITETTQDVMGAPASPAMPVGGFGMPFDGYDGYDVEPGFGRGVDGFGRGLWV